MNTTEKNIATMTTEEIAREYFRADAAAKAEKAIADAMKAALLERANGAPAIITDGLIITIKKTIRRILDQKALLALFPDLKEEFHNDVTSYSITGTEKAEAVQKTA